MSDEKNENRFNVFTDYGGESADRNRLKKTATLRISVIVANSMRGQELP